MGGLQTEHPLDLQVMVPFIESASHGTLPSGATTTLAPIPASWWVENWNTEFDALANRPPVGSAQGFRGITPNDRVMDAFGSINYPDPFLPTDAGLNAMKGRIMRGNRPVGFERVERLASAAAQQDTLEAVDRLLPPIRAAIAVFEYMSLPHVAERINMVRDQVRLQLSYVERDAPPPDDGAPRFVAWWDVFVPDYFEYISTVSRTWAHDSLARAAAPFIIARENDEHREMYETVINAVEALRALIDGMRMPGHNPGLIPELEPPAGGSS
ncbi:hypothetical protein B0T19DRAFT_403278 [Cercophora scortea]|uniref:Uncharacterized protein n=1 Tax=Cercophora scortea TaxID=314031 RepID=A0AAE0I8M8_9PEZI|nr:hypothetical protein B0T19DRAFT_403278 [Cercophora scortea]